MDRAPTEFMPRRNFLALSALGSGLVGVGAGTLINAVPAPAEAAEPDDRSLMEIYADQDARPDGKPVFWPTRGREYIVKGGIVTPLYDRHILLAARLIPQAEGGFKRPYTETDGFTPATREVIVLRDAPATLTGGSAALQIGVHPSKKFASLTELVKALTPQETNQNAAWLENWERLLDAPDDVIIGQAATR